jgi:hypothetical protein
VSLPVLQPNHRDDARALFTDQFRGRKNIQGLSDSFAVSIQTIEGMLWDVINKRSLTYGSGDQLDQIGKLVGEPRNNRNDPNYVLGILLRIRVNRSQGLAEDVIQVAYQALPANPPVYTEVYPAAFYLTVYNLTAGQATNLVRIFGKTRASGVRGLLTYSVTPLASNFLWSSRSGGAGQLGFSDRVSSTGGGLLVASQEVAP